ncbi:hypothetical protein SLOPH_459 [Spraguea lophii 42_110]|uniref:Uncharacterized protein n=1 Tax=Spraguea lophii (strain 42_110) TaxID=1358809 RepID=S7W693_SPRLO|nr:hypothetical protein SLOPH_459 [Spraguea lophii 42_110]
MIMIFFPLAILLFQKSFQTETLKSSQSSSLLKTEKKSIRKNSIGEHKVFYQNDNQENGKYSKPLSRIQKVIKNMDKINPVEVPKNYKLPVSELRRPGPKFVKILSSLSCACIKNDENDPNNEETSYCFKSETEEDDNGLYERHEWTESFDRSALHIKEDETEKLMK